MQVSRFFYKIDFFASIHTEKQSPKFFFNFLTKQVDKMISPDGTSAVILNKLLDDKFSSFFSQKAADNATAEKRLTSKFSIFYKLLILKGSYSIKKLFVVLLSVDNSKYSLFLLHCSHHLKKVYYHILTILYQER
jgi:hypothetical protein